MVKKPVGRPRVEVQADECRAMRPRNKTVHYSESAASCTDGDADYSTVAANPDKKRRKTARAGKNNIITEICKVVDMGTPREWKVPSERTRNICTSLSKLKPDEQTQLVRFAEVACKKLCWSLLPKCGDDLFQAIVNKITKTSKTCQEDRIIASAKTALKALPKESLQGKAIASVVGSALVSGIL
jgi:hypothetical protein